MMKKLLFMTSLLGVLSCKSIPNDQLITVGSGGGFTGIWHQYSLKPSGEIVHKSSKTDSTEHITQLSKTKAKQFFAEITTLRLDSLALNETGNMNYFIEFSEGKKGTRKVQWSNSQMAPDSLKKFYRKFMDTLPK
ncbi:hypothetical protein [Flectobacillus major]|uniref:hypothetical protein n=1 Tax=Flectobacillus major TaxID=103 RepID=UPI0005C5E9E1|nr:hypothetical protein [Flectobacillus major]